MGADASLPRREAVGVLAHTERVHAPDATQARFEWVGRERIVPVTAGHVLLIEWDTPWPLDPRPRPQALCIAGVWHPTVSGLVAATAESFRAGYRAYHDGGRRDHDWAPNSFYEEGSLAEKLAMVEVILDDPHLSEFAYGCLAAGPVENLISHALDR